MINIFVFTVTFNIFLLLFTFTFITIRAIIWRWHYNYWLCHWKCHTNQSFHNFKNSDMFFLNVEFYLFHLTCVAWQTNYSHLTDMMKPMISYRRCHLLDVNYRIFQLSLIVMSSSIVSIIDVIMSVKWLTLFSQT